VARGGGGPNRSAPSPDGTPGRLTETDTLRDEAGITDLALSPDGKLAAVARPDGGIAMWSLTAR
jgi:hypothetical protein